MQTQTKFRICNRGVRALLGAGLLLGALDFFPGLAQEVALPDNERIGPLRLGLAASRFPAWPRCAIAKGPRQLWEADGLYYQTWKSVRCGFELRLISTGKTSAQSLESVRIMAPSRWKSRAGIGIGSSLAAVQKAYARAYNAQESRPGETFVAGSIYGGLIFTFRRGQVAEIFLGAAAE